MTTADNAGNTENGDSGDKVKTEAEIRAEVKAELKKDYVPKTQLQAALRSQGDKLTGDNTRLQARVEALEKGPATKAQRYTRPQLAAAVTAEQITQAEADQLWDTQFEADILAKANQNSESLAADTQRSAKVNADLNRYVALEPELMVEGSAIRTRLQEEINYLVNELGEKDGTVTQLKATRTVLGSIKALELKKAGKTVTENHEETGGAGGGDGKPAKDYKSTLTERQQNYYQQKIDRGIYENWDAVKAELEPEKAKAA